jgi:hypothetical protein
MTAARYEALARDAKVSAIVEAIQAYEAHEGREIDPYQLSDAGWLLLARVARVRPPSETTRALVVARMLRMRGAA